MDEFPVRALRFDVDAIENQEPVWSRTSPKFAVFVNALGVHVPYFERYLISAMRKARPQVRDKELVQDMTRIIGQEANHARNFVAVNALLARRYPKVARFDADAKAYFAKHAEADSLKRRVGFTAGYETFTFLAGLIILDNYQEWLEDSDPVMKAMWVWHQVEEVEHGSVAFNVYKHLYGEHELYRKWMVSYARVHIALETVRGYGHMARLEGWLRNPVKAVSTMHHGHQGQGALSVCADSTAGHAALVGHLSHARLHALRCATRMAMSMFSAISTTQRLCTGTATAAATAGRRLPTWAQAAPVRRAPCA